MTAGAWFIVLCILQMIDIELTKRNAIATLSLSAAARRRSPLKLATRLAETRCVPPLVSLQQPCLVFTTQTAH